MPSVMAPPLASALRATAPAFEFRPSAPAFQPSWAAAPTTAPDVNTLDAPAAPRQAAVVSFVLPGSPAACGGGPANPASVKGKASGKGKGKAPCSTGAPGPPACARFPAAAATRATGRAPAPGRKNLAPAGLETWWTSLEHLAAADGDGGASAGGDVAAGDDHGASEGPATTTPRDTPRAAAAADAPATPPPTAHTAESNADADADAESNADADTNADSDADADADATHTTHATHADDAATPRRRRRERSLWDDTPTAGLDMSPQGSKRESEATGVPLTAEAAAALGLIVCDMCTAALEPATFSKNQLKKKAKQPDMFRLKCKPCAAKNLNAEAEELQMRIAVVAQRWRITLAEAGMLCGNVDCLQNQPRQPMRPTADLKDGTSKRGRRERGVARACPTPPPAPASTPCKPTAPAEASPADAASIFVATTPPPQPQPTEATAAATTAVGTMKAKKVEAAQTVARILQAHEGAAAAAATACETQAEPAPPASGQRPWAPQHHTNTMAVGR